MHKRTARPRALTLTGLASSCVVAALALAALDDITTGAEPEFAGEWTAVSLAAIWFLGGGTWLRKRRRHRRAGSGMRRRHGDARP